MRRHTPRSTRTDTLCPYTRLFRSDTSLDPVKAGDPPQRLLGYRGIATFGVVKEATPDVRPAEGERSRTALPVRRLEMLIGAIAVALDDASEVPEQLFRPAFPATRQDRKCVG